MAYTPEQIQAEMRKAQVRLIPVAELKRYERNAKQHSTEQIDLIVASILEFGWTNPCLVAGRDLLAGHGRLDAAERLGLTAVPCLDLSHLDDVQRRAYILADNQLAVFGTSWDLNLLKCELQALAETDFDLDLLGFTDLDELLDGSGGGSGDRDPDAAPALPVTPKSKPGDVWVCGPHKIMCGDACDPDAWAVLMGRELADVCFTDPPYNVDHALRAKHRVKDGKQVANTDAIAGDKLTPEAFAALLQGSFSALARALKPGGTIYVSHSELERAAFTTAFQDAGFHLGSCLVWRKKEFNLGHWRSDFSFTHEPILYGWKTGRAHKWYGGRKQMSVQALGDASPFERLPDGRYAVRDGDRLLIVPADTAVEEQPTSIVTENRPLRSDLHPTMKPTGLVTRLLRNNARKGDLVVDAFGGSGTTLIAADMLGMSARLMEVDPKYADVIAQRYFDFTGRVPIHLTSGEAFPVYVESESTPLPPRPGRNSSLPSPRKELTDGR